MRIEQCIEHMHLADAQARLARNAPSTSTDGRTDLRRRWLLLVDIFRYLTRGRAYDDLINLVGVSR